MSSLLLSSLLLLSLAVLFLTLSSLFYAFLSFHLPFILAKGITYIFRLWLGATAPCVDVSSFALRFWYRDCRIHALLTVEGFGYGNPPGFPHKYFASCEEISFHISVKPKDLYRFLKQAASNIEPLTSPAVLNVPGGRQKFPWDPTAVEKSPKINVKWSDWYIGVCDVHHLVFIGVTCNFELGPDGELSVNGLERILAESRTNKWLDSRSPVHKRYNKLSVSVLAARNLAILKTKYPTHNAKVLNPFVTVRARDQEAYTKVLMSTSMPSWNETFDMHVSDPSTVVTVNVWDEAAFGAPLIGRWVMTSRFLVTEPENCNHEDDFCVERIKTDKDGKGSEHTHARTRTHAHAPHPN